jgi:hypothetical protein
LINDAKKEVTKPDNAIVPIAITSSLSSLQRGQQDATVAPIGFSNSNLGRTSSAHFSFLISPQAH